MLIRRSVRAMLQCLAAPFQRERDSCKTGATPWIFPYRKTGATPSKNTRSRFWAWSRSAFVEMSSTYFSKPFGGGQIIVHLLFADRSAARHNLSATAGTAERTECDHHGSSFWNMEIGKCDLQEFGGFVKKFGQTTSLTRFYCPIGPLPNVLFRDH